MIPDKVDFQTKPVRIHKETYYKLIKRTIIKKIQ